MDENTVAVGKDIDLETVILQMWIWWRTSVLSKKWQSSFNS